MEPGEKYWNEIEHIWEQISIYDGPEVFLKQYSQVTPKQQILFASHWAQSEIRNGGLHQFFSNSTGVLAPEAVAGYRALKMPECALVIEKAMRFFGPSYPRDSEKRNESLDAYENEHEEEWDPFVEMDDSFFDLIDEEAGGYLAAADSLAEW
jgi:hypothetical protein